MVRLGFVFLFLQMAKKKFLNVNYKGTTTEIDVSGAERLGEVQDAIKAKYGDAIPVAAAFIHLYDNQNNHITDLEDIADEYYKKLKNGGSCVDVHTSPAPSRQPSDLDDTGNNNKSNYKRTAQRNLN